MKLSASYNLLRASLMTRSTAASGSSFRMANATFARGGREAKHGKGGHGLFQYFGMSGCRGRGSAGGSRPFDFHRCDFVFQVHDDALGGFQPDAFHGLEQLVIAGTDDVDQFCRCEGGENHACRVAPMPDTLMSSRKRARSWRVEKP